MNDDFLKQVRGAKIPGVNEQEQQTDAEFADEENLRFIITTSLIKRSSPVEMLKLLKKNSLDKLFWEKVTRGDSIKITAKGKSRVFDLGSDPFKVNQYNPLTTTSEHKQKIFNKLEEAMSESDDQGESKGSFQSSGGKKPVFQVKRKPSKYSKGFTAIKEKLAQVNGELDNEMLADLMEEHKISRENAIKALIWLKPSVAAKIYGKPDVLGYYQPEHMLESLQDIKVPLSPDNKEQQELVDKAIVYVKTSNFNDETAKKVQRYIASGVFEERIKTGSYENDNIMKVIQSVNVEKLSKIASALSSKTAKAKKPRSTYSR